MSELEKAARMALEALGPTPPECCGCEVEWQIAIDALRRALEQPAQQEQEPVDSAEKAGAYMDARLWEFIDMAAAWPEAKPDPRTWSHVMVYAPKPAQEPVALEKVYETIIRWDEGGGKRSRRELARRIVDLYTSPPAQEPVGEVLNERGEVDWISFVPARGTSLYSRPQSMMPLTDEQIEALLVNWPEDGIAFFDFARAIEAAHGIKGDA